MIENEYNLLSGVIIDIRFGAGGNAVGHQVQGWSFPESGFTWSLGSRSEIRIPAAKKGRDLLVVFEGTPFIRKPTLVRQRVQVAYRGSEFFRFQADGAFVRAIRLKRHYDIDEPITLELHYPDRATPAAFGSTDQRTLAIAWKRIRIFEVRPISRGPKMEHEPMGLAVNGKSRLATKRTIQPSASTATRLLLSAQTDNGKSTSSDQAWLQQLLVAGLQANDLEAASAVLAQTYGMPDLTLELDAALAPDISVARCTVGCRGHWNFRFSTAWQSYDRRSPALTMVVWHWLATLPLFKAYAQQAMLPGFFFLSLGDEAHGRGVSFCSDDPGALLIPDPYFMRSAGYNEVKKLFAPGVPAFRQRKPAALWRGSTTGYRQQDGLLGLPRVRLCLLAREGYARELIDAGFTGFVQVLPGDEERLRELDLVRPFVELAKFPEWMCHIDIDGNTSSWPGLYNKLLSGSSVVKIQSERGWRQWYYDRLEHNVNISFACSDMSDLTEHISWLIHHVDEAEALAQAARTLAMSMTYEQEIQLALTTIEEAIVQEIVLHQVDY